MQSHRFDNFSVLPENRAAHDRCVRVANLEEGVASPLVLMGGPGQGKTHLLWSIVNQVRDRHPGTALALITPREFPERVRRLARDPTPIQKSRHAILLVDSLAQFREEAEDLEAVVQVFLENHFSVVLATNRPPIQIESFSANFRRQLTAAEMLTLGGHNEARSTTTLKASGRVQELEARLASLTGERDSIMARLERSQRRVVQLEEEIAALLQKYAALEGSERQGRDAARELVRLQGEVEALRIETDTAREEREASRAAVRQLESECASLREESGRSHDMQHQLQAALEDREAALSEAAQLRDEMHTLRSRVAEVEAERDGVAEPARLFVDQTVALLDALLATHPSAGDSSNEAYGVLAEYIERLRQGDSIADTDLPARLAAVVDGEESAAQRALRAELAEAASEREMHANLYEEARAGQARLDVELGMSRGRLRELQRERDVARQTHRLALTELDAMREQSREELAALRRELAALRWHIDAIAERARGNGAGVDVANALAALSTTQGAALMAPPAAHEVEPQLFEEAHRGRALLQEISRQLAETDRAPEIRVEPDGPLTQAVNEALAWDEDDVPA